MLTAMVGPQYVWAWAATKGQPFRCPECQGEVALKRGLKKRAHFAHVPPSDCSYGEGESAEHLDCKFTLFTSLGHRGVPVWLEHRLPHTTVRPDLLFACGASLVAVEVQRSNITAGEVARRTEVYRQNSVPVLWLAPSQPKTLTLVTPMSWQPLAGRLCFGRVYYWTGHSAWIAPAHLTPTFLRDVPATAWGGGYPKYSTVRKDVAYGPRPVDLVCDFAAEHRNASTFHPPHGQSIATPAAFLWKDTSPQWWQSPKRR